ncbi:hypothetical protein [Porphyromonas somerae]|uniref:hypothetical protein n=1 Tax=Porphyromonas somerae TaxID=322095 RepID=UPI000360F73A|nr:hypothetical protein [Porphyromonas somerae]
MSKIYQSFVSKLGRDVVPGLYDFVDRKFTFLIDIPDDIAHRLRRDFYLSYDEEILMYSSIFQVKGYNSIIPLLRSSKQLSGDLLTDKQLIFKDDDCQNKEDMIAVEWSRIEQFTYKDRTLYLHLRNGNVFDRNVFAYWGSNYIDKEKFDALGYGELFCEALNGIVEIANSENPLTVVSQMIDDDKFEEARTLLQSTMESSEDTFFRLVCKYRYAQCYFYEGMQLDCDDDNPDSEQCKERDGLLKEAITLCKDILGEFESERRKKDDGLIDGLWLRGRVAYLLVFSFINVSNNLDLNFTFVEARRFLFYILESEDEDLIKDGKEILNNAWSFRVALKNEESGAEEYMSFADAVDFDERSVMLVVKDQSELAGMVDEEGNIPLVCTVRDYPPSIQLPIGHPIANTLYFAHPVRPDVYLPFETAYDVLFIEKVKEFCYLCQCLGATEIKFKMTKGSSSASQSNIMNKIGAEVGVKAVSVNGSFDETLEKKNASTEKGEHKITYTFDPTNYPYVPNDLVWLKNNEDWKILVRQRTNGENLLSYTESISSYESSNTSASHNLQLKASFKNLICKVDASFERNVEQTFSNVEEKELVISVSFKSVDQLQKVKREDPEVEVPIIETEEYSDTEKAFIDEIKFAIEEGGTITPLHKVFLEQVRSKLGLSKEVTDALIAEYSDPYTENEKEYMKAVSEYIVDGAIAEGSDRLLVRLAQVLEIDQERALKLQSKCLKQN